MATIRDLAVGSVLTAPSPATSGTTLVLQAGEGSDMPTDFPFKLLVFPTGAVPSKANSEKVLVTARTGDTLTITRAQGETTAKSISSGWLVANAIFTEDIFNSSIVNNEVPVGTIDGTNTAFTLASTPTTGSTRVFLNGSRLKITDDYTISGTTITFVTAPPTGSNLLVDYLVGDMVHSVGTNSYIAKEAVTGSINGSNTVFTTLRAYIAGSLEVYVNGLKQGIAHVTETTPSSGTFTLDTAPATGDIVEVAYQFNLNPSGNADTVDGIHASTTPTPNQIPVLDENARLPVAAMPLVIGCSLYKTANQTITANSFTSITWDGEQYDTVGLHDNTTNNSRVTIPAGYDGSWRVTAQISAPLCTNGRHVGVYKNGSVYLLIRNEHGAESSDTVALVSIDMPLAAGDYIELRAYFNTTTIRGGVLPSQDTSAFQVTYLGRTS